jgi:hypothetical protein
VDDRDDLDVPGLRGVSRTAPYFHNNSAATLEQVVDHDIEFFKLVVTVTPPGTVLPVARRTTSTGIPLLAPRNGVRCSHT